MENVNSEFKTENESKYSIVNVSGVNFGIPVSKLSEVVPMPYFSKLPNVDSEIKGIFSLRGQIYSIVDPRVLLGLKINPINEQNFVIIVKSKKHTFGILVDKVMDVAVIKADAIKEPLDADKKMVPFIKGITKDKKTGLIKLLDIEAIINSSKISRYRFNGD